jgi:hypothetical protein
VKTDAPLDLNAHFESLREANGLILGKYPNVAEAIKGVGHAVTMAKNAFTQRDQLKMELDRLDGELKTLRQTPPTVTPAVAPSQPLSLVPSRDYVEKAQATYDAVLREVVEEGGLLDAETSGKLSKAQRELGQAMAQFAVEETLLKRDAAVGAENTKWSQVDAYMNEHFPDAQRFADEIGLFVKSDPLVTSAVQALAASPGGEVKAAELAWKMFDRARGGEASATEQASKEGKEIALQAADQVRREAVEQARRDAGMPSSSAGGVHEAVTTGPSPEEIEAAAAAMRAYGTTPGNAAAARWRELTIGRSLPKELFGE